MFKGGWSSRQSGGTSLQASIRKVSVVCLLRCLIGWWRGRFEMIQKTEERGIPELACDRSSPKQAVGSTEHESHLVHLCRSRSTLQGLSRVPPPILRTQSVTHHRFCRSRFGENPSPTVGDAAVTESSVVLRAHYAAIGTQCTIHQFQWFWRIQPEGIPEFSPCTKGRRS